MGNFGVMPLLHAVSDVCVLVYPTDFSAANLYDELHAV